MKKILSITLVVAMLMSLFCAVPVSAETTLPDNIGTDYVADASTKLANNMITAGVNGLMGNGWGDNSDFTYAYNGVGNKKFSKAAVSDTIFYFKMTDSVDQFLTDGSNPVAGFMVKTTKPEGVKARVLWSFNFKKDNDNKAVIDVGRRYDAIAAGNEGRLDYSTKYDIEGKEVIEPTKGYVDYRGVFEDRGISVDQYVYQIGFTYGTVAQAMVRMDTAKSYIGLEYAYDMAITPSNTELFAGNGITVDASFINQFEKDFGGDKSITWYATNTDRTEAVNGFAFTENEDGTYAVTVDKTVAAGTYDIVAVSNSNKNIVKGFEVTVEEAPSFEDSVPGEIEGNMVTAGTDGLFGNAWGGNYSYGYNGKGPLVVGSASDRYVYIKPTANITTGFGKGEDPVAGLIVKTTKPAGLSGRVLWSFSFKKDSETAIAFINVGRRNESVAVGSEAYVEYSAEYDGPNKGIAPTTGYKTYTGSFTDKGVASEKYTYEIGFVEGTTAQSMSRIDTTQSYIGYEYAYDMTVEASAEKLYLGNEIVLSAEIVNQFGNEFGGNTKLNWIAMDANRENTVNGFTFTVNEDGTYTATVDETVAAGTYDLVAISASNNKLIKGLEVTVSGNPYVDHVADEATRYSNNMITTGETGLVGNSWGGNYTYGYNGKGPLVVGASGNYVYFKPTADITTVLDSKEDPVAGFIVKTTKPTGQSGRVLWSFSFKADQEQSVKSTVINVGRRNENVAPGTDAYIEYTSEHNGADKGIAPTTGYKTYTGSFVDKGVASEKYTYEIGFVKGTVAQAMARIDTTKSYIGYEYAYDMTVTSEAETAEQGAMFNVEASVVNQIGNVYGGTEAITWKAMSQDRLSEIDGITVTATDKGAAVVEIGEDVVPGTYDIVAVLGDGVMAKGVPVTVTEATVDVIEGITIMNTVGGITVATDTALTDAQLAFVKYDANGKMTALDISTKVTLDAQNAWEYVIPAGFEGAKVILFTAEFKPLANTLN